MRELQAQMAVEKQKAVAEKEVLTQRLREAEQALQRLQGLET